MAVTEALSLLFRPGGRRRSAGPPPGRQRAQPRHEPVQPAAFATHGITPLGYAAFAFALGVTAGALIRRTVPAMAVTLAIFAALQIAMPLWIRPNLPRQTTRSTRSPRWETPSRTDRPGRRHLHALRQQHPRPARRLAPVQRARQRRRAGNEHHPGRLRIGRKHRPGHGRERGRQPTGRRRAPSPSLAAWPATASGRPSPTSPPAATGASRGPRPRSTSPWRWPWPGTASGGSAAFPDGAGRLCQQGVAPHTY